ncbi:EAL domain-containing protein [Terasakiella sp. SH-1]|uniref:EAL domain-containing protein n=1 Tax=Terasakiella sp. SH-1 TaxID=2560057 RepID=UPI001073BF0B|nr:EAL domain-containing protein [Terasakiella sp. SH-1]
MSSNANDTHVLIVDDDPVIRRVVSAFLAKKKYQVSSCKNAEEAFEYLEHQPVDLIVLDQVMDPGMTGLEMLKTLRCNDNLVAVVMLTGADDRQVIIDAMQAGAQDFLLKNSGIDFWLKLEQSVLRALHVAQLEQKVAENHKAMAEQAKFLQTIIDTVPTPIYYKDEELRFLGCNTAMADFLERPIEDILGKSIDVFYPDEIAQDLQKHNATLLKEGGEELVEMSLPRSDGDHHVLSHKARYTGADGKSGIVGAVVDISERKLYENELRLAQTVFDTTSEAIVVTDTQNRIQAVNPSFTRVTGYSEEEVLGRDPGFLSSGRQDQEFYHTMWLQLSERGRWQGEIWNRRKNGDLYAEWLSISSVHDEQGDICQYVAVFSDITKRKKAEELIKHQANYDGLTSLPNRNLFLDRLSRAMMRAKRNGTQVALMFLDLDRFKSVNDTLGHNVGDALLMDASKRLLGCVRETDTVSRLGGDEFTVIIPDIKHSYDIEKVANKILAEMSQTFSVLDHDIFLTASVGITVYPDDGVALEALMRNADTAMYQAKEAGRNSFRFYTPEMNKIAHEAMVLERELRQAIDKKEFVVHYQPVVDVKSGDVISCEALARWNHPARGLVGPGYFISIAEETGLIDEIGAQVLEQVCQQIHDWQSVEELKDIRVAVNLSPHQLRNQNLVEKLQGVMQAYGVRPKQLSLEITETLVMQDPDGAALLLENIRDLGVQIYLDDFGTGYSSLNYLKRFSFDVLKIDRAFIMDVDRDEGDAALVEAIIVMAHKLGIKVVAEGVESPQQRKFVMEQECDMIQGYYYSKPLAPEEFEAYCRK